MIDFLEEKCEDFLQTKLMNQRRERIEKVINLKKERFITNFTALGPVLTIGVTLLLSFPALENLMENLNKKEYLLETYVIVNIISSIGFLYLFREQLKEVKKTLSLKKNLK